jgi:hypothetical protein
MKRLLNKIFKCRSNIHATCLSRFPCAGPTPDWTGPQIKLEKKSPIAGLVCGLFEWALERKATKIRLDLNIAKGQAELSMKNSHDWESMPDIGIYMWSPLIFYLHQISSIESCQGVIKDPATKDKWRFNFTKNNNQIMLSKIE